jgi:hypothetical protein
MTPTSYTWALEVVEHTLVLTLGLSRERAAVSLEVEHEVARQYWLRGERVAENLQNLSLVDFRRRGDSSSHFSGRIRMVQQDRLLAVLDRHRT